MQINDKLLNGSRCIKIFMIVLTVLIILVIWALPLITKLSEESTERNKMNEKAEYKVSSWESQAEDLHKFFEKDRRGIGEDILKDIEECELEFTDEQQKRIDIVIQKIEAILTELEESEETSSIESDSSDGS